MEAIYNSILCIETQKQCDYEIIIIGSDKPISLLILLDYIKGAFQIDKIEVVPKDVTKGNLKIIHAEIEKTKKLLHFKPSVTLKEGTYYWIGLKQ